MRPNNLHTTPNQRFFYPQNFEVQHHESLDTSALPGVKHVGGVQNYAVITTELGEAYGVRLAFGEATIPPTATILGIAGLTRQEETLFQFGDRVTATDLELFGSKFSFMPGLAQGESTELLVMVQACPAEPSWGGNKSGDGVLILPFGQPLQTDSQHNRLLGFIDANDRLITWEGPSSNTASLVDWAVADASTKNALEHALLCAALPANSHVPELLAHNVTALAYLKFYDQKHRTQFTPTCDPRDRQQPGVLTEAEHSQWLSLIRLASPSTYQP